ncbi:uncharacterized protein TRIADDRAFT_54879 [Trichoplax adhaerens]|uniref:Death domain-containing protein n=1 Tax=Trichoplax adhaerens TaxID=10228 RepID=B3RT90_TRIAD|nr:predicted protein [Trichoplax adhaerens]EDV27184.1 predicted protein [Trichoplax adhaerens]|eukprot:XP_002111180.1 predicted protein [Trichoplax adhaerens]
MERHRDFLLPSEDLTEFISREREDSQIVIDDASNARFGLVKAKGGDKRGMMDDQVNTRSDFTKMKEDNKEKNDRDYTNIPVGDFHSERPRKETDEERDSSSNDKSVLLNTDFYNSPQSTLSNKVESDIEQEWNHRESIPPVISGNVAKSDITEAEGIHGSESSDDSEESQQSLMDQASHIQLDVLKGSTSYHQEQLSSDEETLDTWSSKAHTYIATASNERYYKESIKGSIHDSEYLQETENNYQLKPNKERQMMEMIKSFFSSSREHKRYKMSRHRAAPNQSAGLSIEKGIIMRSSPTGGKSSNSHLTENIGNRKNKNNNLRSGKIKKNPAKCHLFPGMNPAKAGYPKVSNNCQVNQDHDLTLPGVPGLKFHLPAQCIADEAVLTMTVYYADPPYNQGLPIQKDADGNHFIQLSPIVRLEPDGYQFTPNSTRKALLQVPVPYINQIVSLLKKNNNFNIPIKIVCRSYGCEKWEQQDVEYEYSRDKNGYYCLTFAVSHFSDYVIYSYVKSTIYLISKHIFPSCQQRINTLAFLSEIDTSDDTVHMKLILAKKDEDETAIVSGIDQAFIRIRLATTGLENTILENGQYTAKFKKRGLDCLDTDFNNQAISINWNRYSYHAIDYVCKVINKAAHDIAQIFLKPIGQQQDTNAKPNPSKQSDPEKLPVLPTKDHPASPDDPSRFFYEIASRIHRDWTKLAPKLDHHINIYEIEADYQGVYNRAIAVLYKWKQNNRATTERLIQALRQINRQDIADILADAIAEEKSTSN